MDERLKTARVFYRKLKKQFKQYMDAERSVVYKSIDIKVQRILEIGVFFDKQFLENCGISTRETGYPDFKFLSEWQAGRVLFLNWLKNRKQKSEQLL